jgi:hypothetical protein
MHVYEIHPRKDHHGVDLISDALPFGRLWYGGPNAIANAKNERTRAQSASSQFTTKRAILPFNPAER